MIPGVLSQLNYRNIQPSTWSPTKMADAVWPEGNPSCSSEDMMGKWRDRTEALHAGNRTRTAKAFATDGTPSLWWRITDQLRPIEMVRKSGFAPEPSPSRGEMLLLHHDPDLKWSPWSDSHRRLRVYETRPVAAEAQGLLNWRSHVDLHHELPPSQGSVQI
jgi:hypothetical protein